MKCKKVLAVLTAAGVLGMTGAAFADVNINVDFGKTVAQTKTERQRPPEPPKDFRGGPASRDMRGMKGRPPEPPRDENFRPMSRDMRGNPPEMPKDGKRPPMHSGDKRPPEMPRELGARN